MRAFAAILLALACAIDAPAATNPNDAARELATRLGRERNVEGLQTILEARNVDLLIAYERGFRLWSMNVQPRPVALPSGIEALMVKHYDDPVIGGPLRILCAVNGTAYKSRRLFDLFFAEWRSRKIRQSTYPMYDSALQTDQPGVEAPLLEWLQAADAPRGEDRRRILWFLGRRQHAPSQSAFIAMLRTGSDPDASTLAWVLVDMGKAEGIDAVLDQVPAWRSNPPKDNLDIADRIVARIASPPASVPIPYRRLQAALPPGDRRYAVTWLATRKDMDALDDVYAQLEDEKQFGPALNALLGTGSPEIRRKTRAEVDRLQQAGRLQGGQYLYAKTILDAKPAEPQRR